MFLRNDNKQRTGSVCHGVKLSSSWMIIPGLQVASLLMKVYYCLFFGQLIETFLQVNLGSTLNIDSMESPANTSY